MLRAALLAIAVASAAPGGAAADGFPARGTGRPLFVVDVVAVPAAPGSVDVEVSWEVPWRELAFRDDGEWYRARYDVAVVFTRGGRQVGGDVWERRVRAADLAESRDPARQSRGRRGLRLREGLYDVRVTLADRTSRASSLATGRVDARFGGRRIGLSELRFVRYTEEGVERNPGAEIPAGQGGHALRVTVHPQAGTRAEVKIEWQFVGPGSRVSDRGDSTVALAGEPTPLDIPVPASTLAPGGHEVQVRLAGGERRTAKLWIRLTPEWFRDHRTDALEVLELLAEKEELERLRAAEDAAWPAALEDFWAARDPAPGSGRNEFRRDVLDRMEQAATLFDEPFRRPGWRTDRGRVLLVHGPPTRRSVRAADFDTPASELWEYQSPRRVFLFVDERGSGEFWLRE